MDYHSTYNFNVNLHIQLMRKKQKNTLFQFISISYVIGSMFLSFFMVDKLDFISHQSYCLSNPIFLCDIPILSKVVRIFDTALLLSIFIWTLMNLSYYFIAIRLGFKSEIDAMYDDEKK